MKFKKIFEKALFEIKSQTKKENEQSIVYDTRDNSQVGTKVFANSRNAHKAMDKMDDKEYLKVASYLFFIDNIKGK